MFGSFWLWSYLGLGRKVCLVEGGGVILGSAGEALRLPQDVAVGDVRGVPDLQLFDQPMVAYSTRHAIALERSAFEQRVEACWGLVACGEGALEWCSAGLSSGQEDWQSDAGGVLRWIGLPEGWKPWLRALLEGLPDGEVSGVLLDLLPETSAADAEPPPIPLEEGLLFGGRMLPFTEPVSFIEAPFADVVTETRRHLAALPHRDCSFRQLHDPLEKMLAALGPVSWPGWKRLVVETRNGWTAVFSQSNDTHAAVVSQRLGTRTVDSKYQRHVVRAGTVQLYGHRSFSLNYGAAWDDARTVSASQQGRWQWHEYGPPEPFEDLAGYTARRIPDRLTLQRINDYCHALGIDRADPDYYLPHGLLIVDDTSSWPNPPRTMTRTEWQQNHL